jgi:hypothetical protein
MGDVEEMKAVLGKLTNALIDRQGVTETAIGPSNGKPCLKVYMEDRHAAGRIPSKVDGHRVEVEATGTFKRRSDPGSSDG